MIVGATLIYIDKILMSPFLRSQPYFDALKFATVLHVYIRLPIHLNAVFRFISSHVLKVRILYATRSLHARQGWFL